MASLTEIRASLNVAELLQADIAFISLMTPRAVDAGHGTLEIRMMD